MIPVAVADTPPKPRRGRGRPRLSVEERQARAGLILGARLANKRTEEICAEFRISKATAYRAFDQAKKMGLVEKARDFLTLDLVPLALAAYEEALTSGELALKVQVAEKVLDGLGITGKHGTLHLQGPEGAESFEAFRAKVVSATRPGGPPEGKPGLLDGEIVNDEPEGAPAAGARYDPHAVVGEP